MTKLEIFSGIFHSIIFVEWFHKFKESSFLGKILSTYKMVDSLYVCETSLFKSVSVKITDRKILMTVSNFTMHLRAIRRSHPEVFLGKGVLKICSKFTGEHLCWRAISIKLLYNFVEITLWHGCSLVNLLHISITPFLKNTSGWLLLDNLCVSLIQISQYRILR